MKNPSDNPASGTTEIRKSSKRFNLQKLMLFLVFAVFFTDRPLQAQVSVNVNISSQTLWGPVGYDHVDYYYMPEVDVFYYVPSAQFIYWNSNQWYFVPTLPSSYSVNLYSTYKVVVNEQKPYLQHAAYITKYKKYKKGGPKQIVIRDSSDEKYYIVKGHPHHGKGQSKSNNNAGPKKSNPQPKKAHKSGENKAQAPQDNAPKGKQGGKGKGK